MKRNNTSNWTEFTTETGLIAAFLYDATLDDYRIKIITKVARGYYYSCVNEAGNYFDEIIKPTL